VIEVVPLYEIVSFVNLFHLKTCTLPDLCVCEI
jgi:hypothetical protein